MKRAALFAMLFLCIAAGARAQGGDALAGFRFIENMGQWDPRALYMLDRGSMRVWMARDEVVYSLGDASGRGHVLRQRFAGAAGAGVDAGPAQEGRWGYTIGSRTVDGARAFSEVRYDGLYPGVDARYYESGGALKYDLLVAPGANPSTIRFTYDGADRVAIDDDGSLAIATSVGTVREGAPYCYQVIGGARREVPCRFIRDGRGIGFAMGAYDRRQPLVIDPTLIYSSYLGGGRSDVGRAVAVGPAGDIYVTGTTLSEGFPSGSGPGSGLPTTAMFVVRLDPTGSVLLNARVMDFNNVDEPAALRLRRDGTVVIAGTTFSSDFRTTAGAFAGVGDGAGKGDGFVAGLSADLGTLRFATYFGGSDSDRVEDMVLDDNDSVFITGWTRSTNLPVAHATQSGPSGGADAFVAELTPDCGRLVGSTYLGGTGDDRATAIDTEGGGAVWIAGSSTSALFLPTVTNGDTFGTVGLRNGFLTRIWFDGTGGNFKVLIGGDGNDDIRAMAVVDGSGMQDTVFITGRTTSADFPVTGPATGGTWFVAKVIGSTGVLGFSRTYSVPGDNGGGNAIRAGADRDLYVLGSTTTSAQFPFTSPGVGPRGGADVAFMRLDPIAGGIVGSIIVGGTLDDIPAHQSVLVQRGGINDLYATGVTGSPNLPLARAAFDSVLNNDRLPGFTDAFVMRFAFTSHPTITGRLTQRFDTLRCGTTGLDTFFVYNVGEADLVINRNIIGGKFTLVAPDPARIVPDTVKPGDSLRYIIRFTSTLVDSVADTLFIYSNDSLRGGAPFKILVTAVRAIPALNAVPDSLAFGSVLTCVASGPTRTVRVTNGGISQATILSVALKSGSPAFTLLPPATGPLQKNGHIDLTVTFKPPGVGVFRDVIEIRVRECDTVFRIPISGIGDTASLAFTPRVVDFGPLSPCEGSADTLITLTNRGTSTLHFVKGQSPVISSEFTRGGTLPDSIRPGESITIRVIFSPLQGSGPTGATLALRFVECDLIVELPLSGVRSGAGSLAANLGDIDFGVLGGCGTLPVSAVRTITLRNQGLGPITVTFDTLAGAFTLLDTASSTITVGGSDSTSFTVRYAPAADGSDSGELVIPFRSGPCPDTLRIPLKGSRERIRLDVPVTTVDFPPLLACDRGADTTLVFENHSANPITVESISASAGAAHLEPLGLPRTILPGESFRVRVAFHPDSTGDAVEHVTYVLGPCGDSVVITLRGRKAGIAFSLRGDRIDFPSHLVCNAAGALDSFMLANIGDSIPIVVRSARIAGDGSITVAAGLEGRSVAPGDSLTIPVRFSASAAGAYTSTLEMVLDPCGDTLRREIAARLLDPSLGVTGVAFGDVTIGGAGNGRVVLRNDNADTITVASLDGAVAPFKVVDGSLPVTLAPGDSVEVEVTFTPSDTLAYAPTLQAAISSPCAFTVAVPVSGRGISTNGSGDIFCLDTAFSGLTGDTIELTIGTITPGRSLPAPTDISYWLGYDVTRLRLLGVSVLPRPTSAGFTLVAGGARIDEHGALTVGGAQIRARFRLLLGREALTTLRLDSVRFPASGGAQPVACGNPATVRINDHCVITSLFRGKFPNRLEDISPNPSGESAEVTYQQLEDARAVLRIHDMAGREVLRPLDTPLPGGRYTVRFSVAGLPSGSYLYSIEAGNYRATKLMVIER